MTEDPGSLIPVGPVPPQSLDAEESLLGAMMLSPRAIDAVAETGVVAADFYRESHGTIYAAIVALHSRGEPADAITVVHELDRRQELEKALGAEHVHELAALVPAASNAAHYARIVSNLALRRVLIRTGNHIAKIGFEGNAAGGEGVDLLEEAEQAVFDVSQKRERTELVSAREAIPAAFRRIQELAETGQDIIGTPTGFRDLDRLTSGFHPGNLVVLAARPSMGKALGLDANVLTPTGWRRNGDLQSGDLVIGGDGHPDKVVGVHDEDDLDFFRVTFSDGATVECCGDHHWMTRTRAERRRGTPGQVRTTREILETIGRSDSPGARNHSVPFVKPVRFAAGSKLPLDPYLLGLYLGDGDSGGNVRFSNPEEDLRQSFRDCLPEGDVTSSTDDVLSVRRIQRNNQQSNTKSILAGLGLAGLGSHERFVPADYLTAAEHHRVALLQGICDTDGFVTDPGGACVEVSTSSDRLRDGILFLVGSLGGRATYTTRPTHYTVDGVRHEARDAHRIVLSFPNGEFIPVRSQKHMAKWRGGPHMKGRERMIASVTPIGTRAGRCIEVMRGLYVTDHFVVTHNSGLALGIVGHVAVHAGLPVVLFTLEMSQDEVMQRLLSLEGMVDSQRIRNGRRLDSEDWSRLLAASGRLEQAPIYVDDSGLITVGEIRSKARRLKARHPNLGLIVVDYLQLMTSDGSEENRVQQIAAISRSLKILAREVQVPVLALSQLSRQVEGRHDKRPMLQDLRESGAIEQDADVVAFIYRDEYYNPDEFDNVGIAEVIVGKQRNGPTGTVKLHFKKEYARFSDLAHDYSS